MPFIGNQPALSYTSFAKQDFTTSATTSYTLDNPVANANELALFINNVRQEPTTAYSASGTSLTLTEATSASDDMYAIFLGKAIQTVTPANNSVTGDMLSKPFNYDSGTLYLDDTNNRVGIGTSSPSTQLHLNSTNPAITLTDTDTNADHIIGNNSTAGSFIIDADVNSEGTGGIILKHKGSNKFATDNDGHLYLNRNFTGTTVVCGANSATDVGGEVPGLLVTRGASANATISGYMGTSVGGRKLLALYSNAGGTSTLQHQLNTDGYAYNRTGTWGTISDQTLKENITDATSKLDEVKQLRVRNFNLIGDDLKQIGFIAQEIEQVFPNIVDTPTLEDGTIDPNGHKKLKTTVLIPVLTKALQEAITKIEQLETRIQTLENN